MRSTPYTRILIAIAAHTGLGWPIQTEDAEALRAILDQRLGEAWELGTWPEWESTEERVIRPEWDAATAYTIGQEVYDVDQGHYYRALGSVTAGTLVTDAAKWVEFTPDPIIELDQTGETSIGEVLGAWDADPRTSAAARDLPYTLTADGIHFGLFGGNTVWLRIRFLCPRLEGAPWDATATYALGDTVYFEDLAAIGNFYTSIAATNTANYPDTAATKWAVIEIPYILEKWLVKIAVADWLAADGRDNTAALNDAGALFAAAQDKILRQQGQMPQIRVGTY